MRYWSDNVEVLSPKFVAATLKGIQHRFIFVMECECRLPPQAGIIPPNFSVAGRMASIDPIQSDFADLISLKKHKLQLLSGWEKIHQFMYVLTPETDDHGWQYRSSYPEHMVTDDDEQWSKDCMGGKGRSEILNVRRRIWMATIGRADQLIFSKNKLAEGLAKRQKVLVMEGELLRHELTPGTLTKTWQKRYVYLFTNTVEIYTVSKSDGGRKLAEIQLQECECHILFGSHVNDRPYSFSLSHHSRSTALAVFDAENRDVRRRWCVALRYAIALLTPGVNFYPLDYAPPTGDDPTLAVLMCGELDKLSYDGGRNWTKMLVVLRSTEFSLYIGTELQASYSLGGAEVTPLEGSLDFTVKSESKICVLRAANVAIKTSWLRSICRQIAILGRRGHSVVATLRVKSNTSTPTGAKSNNSTPNGVVHMGAFFPAAASSSGVTSSAASGPLTPTNASAAAAASSVAATISAVSDKLFSASPLPSCKQSPSSTDDHTNSNSKPESTQPTPDKKHKQKAASAAHHDADMFGEMELVDHAHDDSYSSSDEEDDKFHHNNQEEIDQLLRKTSSGNITAMGRRAADALAGKNPPGTGNSSQTSPSINANAKHSYIPASTPRTLPKTPSTLMRAASMKVLSTTNRDNNMEEFSTAALNSSPPSRLSNLQEKAVTRQSSVLQKVLTLESRIEEKKDERLSRSFYIPSTSKSMS